MFQKIVLSTLFLVCAFFTPSIVLGENSSSEGLPFLENFAIKIYNRNDIPQAKKEFERILQIDPTNATAKKYLNEISTRKDPEQNLSQGPVLKRLNDITADIKRLNNEITNHEKETQTLGLTIRSLITENDSLYVALRKRTRDLAELREKFQGTPYNEQYSALMKDLPLDRIPQRVTDLSALLPGTPAATPILVPSSENDLESLTQEISKTESELKTLRATSGPDEEKIRELETVLRDKRALLTEKTASLIENKKSLLTFQSELITINSSLKDANTRYLDAITNLEKLAQDIKTEASLNDAETQKKYRELLDDYATKIKELDQLKTTIANRDATLTQIELTLTDKHKTLASLDSSIQEENLRVQEYRTLLSELKNKLAKKDQVIEEKDQIIANKNQVIDEKARIIANKDQVIDEKTQVIANKDQVIDEKTQVIANKDQVIDEKTQIIANKDQVISEKDISITEKTEELSNKNATLAKQDADLKFTDHQLVGIDQRVGSIQNLLIENDRDIAQLQEGISKVKALIQANTTPPQQKKRPLPAVAPPPIIQTNPEEIKALEKTIEELNKTILTKSDMLSLLQLKLTNLENELSARETEVLQKDEDLLSSQEKLAALERTVSSLQDESDLLKSAPPQTEPKKQKIRPPQISLHPSSEITSLHNILATRDKTIVELNKKNILKNIENRKLSTMVDASQAASNEKNALIQEVALLNTRLSKINEEKKSLENSRCALQNSELDIQEKNALIHDLQKTIEQRTTALTTASQQITVLQESLAVFKIKQDAIKDLIEKRDKELATLKKQLPGTQKGRPAPASNPKNIKIQSPKIDVLQRSIQDQNKQIAQLKKNLTDIQNKLKKRNTEKNQLGEKVKKQAAEISALKKKLNTKKK
ncbi:MAG: hypothetical protein HQL21_02325 [Candidatus Omnitrophica bacterium]|nr:hypothetical protein [Candidatus Omnitrophota bacterium]